MKVQKKQSKDWGEGSRMSHPLWWMHITQLTQSRRNTTTWPVVRPKWEWNIHHSQWPKATNESRRVATCGCCFRWFMSASIHCKPWGRFRWSVPEFVSSVSWEWIRNECMCEHDCHMSVDKFSCLLKKVWVSVEECEKSVGNVPTMWEISWKLFKHVSKVSNMCQDWMSLLQDCRCLLQDSNWTHLHVMNIWHKNFSLSLGRSHEGCPHCWAHNSQFRLKWKQELSVVS